MGLFISQHYGLAEFSCHDGPNHTHGTPYPAEWIAERLSVLCAVLEIIRTACGNRPVTVLSGYRTEEYNATRQGAASDSQHPKGRAADIRVEGMAPSDVHRVIMSLYEDGKLPQLGGLGRYVSFCHVDVRPQDPPGHLARWKGPGVPWQ